MAEPNTDVAPTNAPDQAILSGVIPYLTVSDANAAADFYKRAFDAKEIARMPAKDGKRLMHCHLQINGGTVMLSDGFPEQGHPALPPQAFMLHQQVRHADPAWKRAIDAGCEVITPLDKMFWGDFYGQFRDPFGVVWSMGATER